MDKAGGRGISPKLEKNSPSYRSPSGEIKASTPKTAVKWTLAGTRLKNQVQCPLTRGISKDAVHRQMEDAIASE
jgi:hypothetical protein